MLLLRLTGWAAGKAGSRAAWLDSTVDSVPTCSTVFIILIGTIFWRPTTRSDTKTRLSGVSSAGWRTLSSQGEGWSSSRATPVCSAQCSGCASSQLFYLEHLCNRLLPAAPPLTALLLVQVDTDFLPNTDTFFSFPGNSRKCFGMFSNLAGLPVHPIVYPPDLRPGSIQCCKQYTQ